MCRTTYIVCSKLKYTHTHVCAYTHTNMIAHLEINACLSRENLRDSD